MKSSVVLSISANKCENLRPFHRIRLVLPSPSPEDYVIGNHAIILPKIGPARFELGDLLNPIQALYQAEPRPVAEGSELIQLAKGFKR